MIGLNKLEKWHKGIRTPYVTPKGYLRVWDGKRLVMEHRAVMEKKIGRPLSRAERVHHKDGNRQNNGPDNLVLYATQAQHIREAHPDLVTNFSL